MRVLVVEDEARMALVIRRSLVRDGAAVDITGRGAEAVWMAQATSYDAIVLDVMLPDLSGFDVCRRLRAAEVWSPVLMLTARDAVRDRVEGLDSGADDYLVKPFSLAELHARLRSLVRRGARARPVVLSCGEIRFDPASRRVWRGETEVELSVKEQALLEVLISRQGEVVSRLDLIEHAWDMGHESRSNVVDVHIRRLREKLDRPFGRASIETVRGAGYRLREGG